MITFSNFDSVFDDEPKWYEKWWFLILIGLFIGFVNGFWGGGGGMLCVPVLGLLLRGDEKRAHATTIFVMLPLCIASFVVYLVEGFVDWSLATPITLSFVVGGAIGALALKRINNVILQLIFAFVIIAGGIRLVM